MLPAKLSLEHYDAQVLQTLLDIARALDSSTRVKAGLNRALEIVEKLYTATRSAVVVRASRTSELRIEASRGLTPDEQRAFLRIEDGLTDRVMESGKPVVVPKAGGESLFFQRGGARTISQSNETTFICVPLIIDRAPSGALGVDMRYEKNRDYDHILEFLSLVASMMSQALRIAHLADAETYIRPPADPRRTGNSQGAGRSSTIFRI